jgi:hypothetical protein
MLNSNIKGLQFIWVACDRNNHLAVFNTAGGGFVDERVFNIEPNIYDQLINEIYTKNKSGQAIKADPTFDQEWQDIAERGFYCFDWLGIYQPISEKRYQKIAAPTKPLSLSDLPLSIQSYSKTIKLKEIDFQTVKSVTV